MARGGEQWGIQLHAPGMKTAAQPAGERVKSSLFPLGPPVLMLSRELELTLDPLEAPIQARTHVAPGREAEGAVQCQQENQSANLPEQRLAASKGMLHHCPWSELLRSRRKMGQVDCNGMSLTAVPVYHSHPGSIPYTTDFSGVLLE